MKPLEIVAHAKYKAVRVPLDHINMHIGMPKRDKLGWPVHAVQIGKKLKQLAVVLLIEIHVDSTLFAVREPSMEK